MNFNEILESGKKFRRKSWKHKHVYYYSDIDRVFDNIGRIICIKVEEILADDWEVIYE